MDTFPYTGIKVQTKEGLKHLCEWAERVQLLDSKVTLEECFEQLWSSEDEAAAEATESLWETQWSARPNCFD